MGRGVRRWVWVGMGLCLLGGCGISRSQRQRDFAAESLLPQRPAPTPTKGAPQPLPPAPTKLSVRVWPDVSFRALHGWQREIETQLELANEALEPHGITLVPTSFREWDHDGVGDDLSAAIRALEAVDPGVDVDLVLGFTTPLPLVSSAVHELGIATTPGRHIVMRGMDDLAERDALRRILDLLGDEELDRIYRLRKRHKQQMVLVHEVAHALGVIHSRLPESVMSPTWSVEVTGLQPPELELVRVGLRHRRHLDGRAAWQAERAALLRASGWDGWDPGERTALLAAHPAGVRALDPGLAARTPAAQAPAPPRAGEVARAAPSDGRVTRAPDGGWPATLEPKLAALRPVAPALPPAVSAEAAIAEGRAAEAERLLAQAPRDARATALRASIAQLRREVALPPNALDDAEEAAYVAAMRTALTAAFARKQAATQAAAVDVERRFPRAPGGLVLRCFAAYLDRNERRAAPLCATALQRYADAVVPRYLSALMSTTPASTVQAEAALVELTETAPWFESAWASLAAMFRARRASNELERLAARYRGARGGEPAWAR